MRRVAAPGAAESSSAADRSRLPRLCWSRLPPFCRSQRLTRGAAAAALALLIASSAAARSDARVANTKAQVFSAALRYLRVDRGFEVIERDAEAAYLLFLYPTPNAEPKQVQGAIEMVETGKAVKVSVSLPTLPAYQEEMIKRGLLDKLRQDYPSPSRRPSEPSKPDEPEAPKAPAG